MIRMVCTRHPSNASSHLRHMRACGGSVAIYVDAGHGGWIGFEENAKKFAAVVDEMGITPYIISPCPCPSFVPTPMPSILLTTSFLAPRLLSHHAV